MHRSNRLILTREMQAALERQLDYRVSSLALAERTFDSIFPRIAE